MEGKIKSILFSCLFFLGTTTVVIAQVWQPLANGLEATPTAITTEGNLMAVAYNLGYDKEHKVHQIAIWNGSYWAKLPKILSDSHSRINALLFKDSVLYIGGKFSIFNNVKNPRNIVRWTWKSYEPLPGLSATSAANEEVVLHLGHLGDVLIVAGNFKNDELNGGNNLAFFNDGKWISGSLSQLTNINGTVNTTAVADGKLYIGGRFTKIGNNSTQYLASFNVTQAFKREKNDYIPIKMVSYDANVVFWGEHSTDKAKMPEFFIYNSDTLMSLDDGIEKVNDIYDIASDGKVIYAVGDFTLNGNSDKQNFIRYADGKWQAMPGGIFTGLKNIDLLRQQVIVTGAFKTFRNIKLLNVARYLPNYGAVAGRIYYDKDEDCIFNFRDENLSDRLINIEPGGFYIRPEDNGEYLVYLKEGKYTFKVLPRKYWSASSCDKLEKTVVVEDGLIIDTLDFALVQDTSIRDLSVKLLAQSGGLATRKNVQLYYLNFENLGSNEVNDGVLTLHFDPNLVNIVADRTPEIKGDSAVWKNLKVLPGISDVIKCKFEISAGAEEKLNLSASIRQNQPTNDVDEDNNHSQLVQKIQEEDIEISKQVNPGVISGDTAYITEGTTSVDYHISFSNYSSDTVNTVYVVDTIQINHSMQQIKETGASHPYSYQIIPGKPGENVATIIWTFRNINLAPNPTKNGEIVNDDGFIGFRIGLKPNLQSGVVLTNKAQVAFDYSEEKGTNSVYAMVMEPDGIFQVSKSFPLKVYPNPCQETLYIGNWDNTSVQYQVITVNGKILMEGTTGSDNSISTHDLASGLYHIRFVHNDLVYSTRFIKL